MDRLNTSHILADLNEKMVFLTGPRQVGKTTLARTLISTWSDLQYLNYDDFDDRTTIRRREWSRDTAAVVLDEVHKMKKWKTHLKGVYDTEGNRPRILVTGSARLDVFRRGGDSLAGRYFRHRLYPFSVRELRGHASPQEILEQLMLYGGFPEPFLAQSERRAKRWRKQHLERIIRTDVQDLEPVRDIQSLIVLVDLLRERVGSTISYASLARDLEISPHTVKRWIQTLEHMYVIFTVRPYHKRLSRAHLKEPKVYFFDTGAVIGDVGARLENAVAGCLYKWLHFLEDTQGSEVQLCYIRDKEKREVDFVPVIDREISALIEVKHAQNNLHPALAYYKEKTGCTQVMQLVYQLETPKTVQGIHIRSAAEWLDTLDV